MRRFLTGRLAGSAQVLIVGGILAMIAFAIQGASGVNQATIWMVFGLFAISVDLMWGYCGLMSFGQAAFFGLGAFCYTWLTTNQVGLHPTSNGSVLGLLLAMVLPALLALSMGYFLFYGRVVGAYFTIVTFAFSFLMQSLGTGWNTAFGGFTGIPNVPPIKVDLGFAVLSAGGVWTGFIVVTVIIALVVLFLRGLLRTPFGLAVDGVRDNEERLTFLGSRTVQTKLIVFVISSAIAGLAGALYAAEANYVGADLMGTLLSTEAVMWVAVGGRRTLVGALIGALVVRAVGYWLSGVAVDYWNLLLGVLFVVLVLAGSSGVTGLGKWVWRQVKRAGERGGGRIAAGNS
jgi:urea transport system permease protein